MSAESKKMDLVAKSLRELPDILVAVQLDLKPLCEGQMRGIPDAAKKTLADACALIDKSIGRVMTVLEYIDEWTEGVADQTQPPRRIVDGNREGETNPE
jgi:hypothetical protein